MYPMTLQLSVRLVWYEAVRIDENV